MSRTREATKPRPIVATKFRPPPTSGILRERLLRSLSQLGPRSVGLVVAPAGAGKTTLLTQLIRRAEGPAAWYSVDEADADPTVFLRQLQATLTASFGQAAGRWTDVRQAVRAMERWSGA